MRAVRFERWILSAFAAGGLLLAVPSPVLAQAPPNQGLVVRDGSLGERPAGVVPPGLDPLGQPADYLIAPELGEQRGRNLFHSFERFDVGTGETATFTGPDDVSNVIGRVTSGDPSDIDGTLRSTIDGADLYLLNPAGIVFGPNAELDVRGAFHASTAESLEFSTGETFEAKPGGALPILVTAEPSAFGFLGEATIELRGSFLSSSGRPGVVPPGILLAGGNVELRDGARIATYTFGQEKGGDISITAAERLTLEGFRLENGGDIHSFSEAPVSSRAV